MSSADASAPAPASEHRSSEWDTRPVQPEWGGQVRGFALLLLAQLSAGAVLGLILYGTLKLTGTYVPMIAMVVFGLALGSLAREMATRGGFDNFIVGAVCVGLGSLAALGSFHAGRYYDFVAQLDNQVQNQLPAEIRNNVRMARQVRADVASDSAEFRQILDEFIKEQNAQFAAQGRSGGYVQWVKDQVRDRILRTDKGYYQIGTDSFAGYLMLEAERGIITKLNPDGSGKTLNPGMAGNLGYRAVEILAMAGIGIFFLVPALLLTPRTKESQNRLPGRVPLVLLVADNPDAIRSQVGSGGVADLDLSLRQEPGVFPAIEIAVRTPATDTTVDALKETGEPEVVIEVSRVNSTARGDLRHRRIGSWWYPTGVLTAIEKQFGPPPVAGAATDKEPSADPKS